MAFHIDCAERHGLVSIDRKPASYGALDWKCDACHRRIPDLHIGVLHCEQCRRDICPDCWTVLIPKIVNAAGYPCFWMQTKLHTPRAKMLGCHRANVGNYGSVVLRCGVDCPFAGGSMWCNQPVTQQCIDCANKQCELQREQAVPAVAAVAPHAAGGLAPIPVFPAFVQPQQPPVFTPAFAPPSGAQPHTSSRPGFF